LLAEIDTRPFEVMLAQAEAQLVKDKAALHIAQLDLNRYNALRSSGSVTQQQIDAQVALVQQCQGAIEADQATINNANLQLTYCHIVSPVNGRVGLRLVDPGNIVRANDIAGLLVITQLQPIAVVFTIPQDSISQVQQRFNEGHGLVVDAYDREFRTKLASGTLLALDNQVDVTTGTVKLKAIFPNEDNMLFPNQFVNARLRVDTLDGAVIAPSAAVQRGPEGMFAYVVKPDSTVELRKIEIGPVEGDSTAIVRGLTTGDTVVTDGVDKLQPGSKVAIRDLGHVETKQASVR
jgi:multidrug efflux system membrane fusion protein